MNFVRRHLQKFDSLFEEEQFKESTSSDSVMKSLINTTEFKLRISPT